jgi:hypothetical protein
MFGALVGPDRRGIGGERGLVRTYQMPATRSKKLARSKKPSSEPAATTAEIRDEFTSTMLQLREVNRPVFDALMTVLRMDKPQRDAALLLMRCATPPPPPTNGLAAEALALFAEITDPAAKWCITEESVDATVYHIILKWISFGDRGRAARFLATLFTEHASQDELREVIAALKTDRHEKLKYEALESGALESESGAA